MTRVNHHPADLPALVIEQAVPKGADAPVARLDRASEETGNGEQHGATLPRNRAPLALSGRKGRKTAFWPIVYQLAGFVTRSKGRREALTGFAVEADVRSRSARGGAVARVHTVSLRLTSPSSISARVPASTTE